MRSFLRYLRKSSGMSEREIAQRCDLARDTVRNCEHHLAKMKVETIAKLASQFEYDAQLIVVPKVDVIPDLSVVAVSLAIEKDGFDSWKIHLFNMVDAFRIHPDVRLLILPPVRSLDMRIQALISAVVRILCDEVELDPPLWTLHEIFLPQPWFVAGIESLKASSLLETPVHFRRHNIFVLENFLERL